jgi:hypothetical protein
VPETKGERGRYRKGRKNGDRENRREQTEFVMSTEIQK